MMRSPWALNQWIGKPEHRRCLRPLGHPGPRVHDELRRIQPITHVSPPGGRGSKGDAASYLLDICRQNHVGARSSRHLSRPARPASRGDRTELESNDAGG